MTTAVAAGGLGLASGHAPGHAGFAIGREIAEGHIDEEPLLKDAVHGRRDLFLEEGQAGIGEVLCLRALRERDHSVAGSLLKLRPKLREARLALLRQNAEEM